MLLPSLNRYNTRSPMTFDIPLQKTNAGQQAISFLGPKIWTKIYYSDKNVKNKASFTHNLKRGILTRPCS